MKYTLRQITKRSLLVKVLLFAAALFAILQVFPEKAKFKYEFRKGELWQHDNLYAPFDFPLKKTKEQINAEKAHIKASSTIYYQKDDRLYNVIQHKFQQKRQYYFTSVPSPKRNELIGKAQQFLAEAYARGVIVSLPSPTPAKIAIIKDKQITELPTAQLISLRNLSAALKAYFNTPPYNEYLKSYNDLFFDLLEPNITVDQTFTQKALEQNLRQIVYTRDLVSRGKLIIAKGELIEGEKLTMLNSLKEEYESDSWNQNNYTWLRIGYYTLVAIALYLIALYLKTFDPKTYRSNRKIAVILINMILMILLVGVTAQHFPDYIYVVPVTMMMLILKAFFDLRTVTFIYLITILILGFIVPGSFQFVFIQSLAAIGVIITPKGVHYRLSNFISAILITSGYLITYTAFHTITEGSPSGIDISLLTLFVINGIGVLFSLPFTYVFERLFSLVSDVSLLELSDTNTPLLRALSEKAPGTFQHSMQVANLAEAAAAEIGANALLTRVGALYHDIGKMENPAFFTENQKTSLNPHDRLSPIQSARVIIKHVTDGIELARRYKLPDRLIDFIRTHHGRSLVYFFYRKELDTNPEAKEEDFRYPGPTPSTKETAILMMADSVEAATKSLQNPTYEQIDDFVDKIIKKQLDDNQFAAADITFKEIETVKKVLKNKLTNIYHTRIQYPE
ncbi:hypothetical protein SAMN05444369_10259 [Capnocytophaga haemolytica]|jgi:metal dependent phosphohydrolase|uniref:Phosphohydrolase n=1 Tax=Capnocytophaga haemolytica TaxID=45243 RepID=A0AAX2GWT8_9FLAO|nr:HDIG domain-containing metalloprotein [Capnocytophaga haemolytica]AMD84769.1 phosphohydrolase [Capnocytophaga haemolytica]SFN73542.1 hypothetical protein SAMN05444369_10259 [Capnocytophaga haemolytica]SNV07661.1 Predicted HD superfamily hydrolase [Capnocytophaga haemolytica]